jgi:catechol 2,3-dioxygenase-like lactoylglutathione lyase family enzyme
VVALQSRDDVAICRECLGWLRAQSGVIDSTPTLPVSDLDQATAFYTRAGFDVRRYEGGGFAFVSYEDESVFDLDPADQFEPSANRAGCYLVVPDADAWHRRLRGVGLPVSEIADQPWGMREFTLSDPDGNQIRLGHGIDA